MGRQCNASCGAAPYNRCKRRELEAAESKWNGKYYKYLQILHASLAVGRPCRQGGVRAPCRGCPGLGHVSAPEAAPRFGTGHSSRVAHTLREGTSTRIPTSASFTKESGTVFACRPGGMFLKNTTTQHHAGTVPEADNPLPVETTLPALTPL